MLDNELDVSLAMRKSVLQHFESRSHDTLKDLYFLIKNEPLEGKKVTKSETLAELVSMIFAICNDEERVYVHLDCY